MLLHAIERTAEKIKTIATQQEETRIQRQLAQLEHDRITKKKAEDNKSRLANEVDTFLEQLNGNGLKEIPGNNSYDEIKFRRLKDECSRHRLLALKSEMEQAYASAYVRMRDTYLQKHFPQTFSGWNPDTDYTTELHQLFGLQRRELLYTKSRSERSKNTIQLWHSELLKNFTEIVVNELNELHNQLLGLPQIDQAIQIRKNGGDHARRLTRCLKVLIQSQKNIMTLEDLKKTVWLRDLVQRKSLVR